MKKKTIKQLHAELWKLFSQYVRLRDGGVCITCGRRDWDSELGEWSIKGMHAGHFHHNVLDFDEINIHCQCPQCNTFNHGKLNVYARTIIQKYGLEAFEALADRATKALAGERNTSEWYQDKIEYYNKQVDRLRLNGQ